MKDKTVDEFSLKEVSDHTHPNSTWIIIHNNVYDVTNYLLEHPGGLEILEEQAGKDVTELFEMIGHSEDAKKILKDMHIGKLVEKDKITIQDNSFHPLNHSKQSKQWNICLWKMFILATFVAGAAWLIYQFFNTI